MPSLPLRSGRVRARGLSASLALFLLALFSPPSLAANITSGAWNDILSGINGDITVQLAEIEAMREEFPRLRGALEAQLSGAASRLNQLMLLRGVAGHTPWASRSLLIHLDDLGRFVDEAADPVADLQRKLARMKQEYATIRSIKDETLTRSYDAGSWRDLSEVAERFHQLKAEVDGIKEQADRTLSEVEELKKDLEQAHQIELDRYIVVFGEYYFAPAENLLTGLGWRNTVDALREWTVSVGKFLGPILSFAPWPEYAVLAVAAVLLLYAIAWRVLFRLEASRPGQEAEFAAYRVSLAPLCLGAALFLADEATLFARGQVTILAWVVLATLGVSLLTGAYLRARLGQDPAETLKTPFFSLWLVFALAAACQAVNMPGPVLGPVSAVLLGLGAAILRKTASAAPRPVEKPLLRFTAWLFLLLALAGLVGFGPQALILAQVWFMFLLVIRFVAVARRIILPGQDTEAPSEDGQAASNRLGPSAPLVYTLAVTLIQSLYLCWVLAFMGGPGFVAYVLDMRFELGEIKISLMAVLALIVTFFLVRLLVSWLRSFLDTGVFRGRRIDPALGHTIGAMVSYSLWVLYVTLGLGLLGVSLHALTFVASGLSVGIGFGLKDIVNNFISGLIILFGGSIKKGDIIQQGKNLGEVVDVSVRNTTIRTLDNVMVIIPNSSFLRGEIVNLSYHDSSLRLTIPVTVAPGTKIKKVTKVLLGVAKDNPMVLKKPKAEVNFRQFGRAGLEFDLYVWIDNYMKKFQVESELATEIDKRFQENKITVAFQGVKVKYKPRGTEEMQIEAQREALRQKRRQIFFKSRRLRRVHSRRRWNVPSVDLAPGEDG